VSVCFSTEQYALWQAIALAVVGGNYLTVAPVPQTSTNSSTVVAGSAMDARTWTSVSYTITVVTHDVAWSVWGANLANYSDETIVTGPTVIPFTTAAAYSVDQASFAFYRVKIADAVGGTHGIATVNGIMK
jgi:hypothetical protein